MIRVLKLKTIIFTAISAMLITVLSLSVYFTGAYAVYYGNTPRLVPIYSVEKEEKIVSISFDCAWGTEHTDEILNALKVSEVRATWFMVEFWAEKYPEYLKKVSDAGHEVGTHSATHSYMSKLSESEIENEFKTSCAAIEKVTGKPVDLFRPPYGDYDDLLINTSNNMGLYPIQWDVDSLDWKDLSASDIAQRIVSRTKSGSIILCHNNGLHTAEALPIVIDKLRANGFEFVPIGELIYKENYIVDSTGKQISKATS